MTKPSYDACMVEAELRARAAYAEPGRHYHDTHHLDDCLRQAGAAARLDERDRRRLRWAVLWHDAVYEPQHSDNEERSAELARRELSGCGVAAGEAAEVERLILLTSDHRADQGDRLGALMVSIDLSILGSNPERYRAYTDAVRREYSHLSDEQWRSGRSAVLERLLESDPLFADPEFRRRLEARARRNMEEELRRLSAG